MSRIPDHLMLAQDQRSPAQIAAFEKRLHRMQREAFDCIRVAPNRLVVQETQDVISLYASVLMKLLQGIPMPTDRDRLTQEILGVIAQGVAAVDDNGVRQ